MNTFVLVCGPPGSGKTTMAKTLGGLLFEVDDFPGLYDENGRMILEKLPQAHAWCKAEVEKAFDKEYPIVVHTIIDDKSPNTEYYVKLAFRYDYIVDTLRPERPYLLFHYKTDPVMSEEEQIQILLERRGPNSGKYVPESVIRKSCDSLKSYFNNNSFI